jgi:hypothetical protein
MGEDALIVQVVLSLLLAGVHGMADRPLAIGEVWANHNDLDGKTIQVVGVLKGCDRWTCIVAEGSGSNAKFLSVDLDKTKMNADTLLRHRLIVEGRFDATCLLMKIDPPKDRVVLCTDAATTLHSARIVRVL